MPVVFVSGGFDDPLSPHVRFLQEASRRGPVHVLLWSDEAMVATGGRPPRFPLDERRYFVENLRYVARVTVTPDARSAASAAGVTAARGDLWAAPEGAAGPGPAGAVEAAWCLEHGVQPLALDLASLAGFPAAPHDAAGAGYTGEGRRRAARHVVATGSFDWLHTGHVRFFEEAAALGELAVVVGHDANIRVLKGEGHPHFGQEERLFMVAAVRTVARALLSTGTGWMDAAPEIERLRPEIYVVNEDGDKPEKRAFCHGARSRVRGPEAHTEAGSPQAVEHGAQGLLSAGRRRLPGVSRGGRPSRLSAASPDPEGLHEEIHPEMLREEIFYLMDLGAVIDLELGVLIDVEDALLGGGRVVPDQDGGHARRDDLRTHRRVQRVGLAAREHQPANAPAGISRAVAQDHPRPSAGARRDDQPRPGGGCTPPRAASRRQR